MTDKLTIGDIRKTGFCVRGVVRYCEEQGYSSRTLIREGLPLSEMEKIDNHNLQRCVKTAKKRIEGG